MGPLTIHHLSGPRRGATDRVAAPAAIGSDPASVVVVPGSAALHATLFEREDDVVVKDAGSGLGIFLAGESVQEAVLRDGDVLELGEGGPKLRFRLEGAPRVSFLQALLWAQPEGVRFSDGGVFTRMLLQETTARTSRTFRVALAVALTASGAVLLWSHWQSERLRDELERVTETLRAVDAERLRFEARIEGERRRSEAQRSLFEARIEEYRKREEELNRRLAEAASGEVRSLRQDLSTTRTRLAALESERAAGERIIREYGAGVGLIQASYAFYDEHGRPLRYRVDETGRPLRDADGSLTLGTSERGPVHTVDAFGTGFLVDGRGLMLTNRHIAEPWWRDETAENMAQQGFKPRFVLFRAFFPREPEPFELDIERHAERADLSLLRLEPRGRKIPVLPLDQSGHGAVPGQPVVVVGYPTGLEAILAKADSGVVQGILESHGTSSERVADALGREGLIRPSTTQGHIGDVTPTDIVFDAATTQGGSGGPIFNKAGHVIAVEYAVLSKFRGNSFGVPVAYALELLKPRRVGS